MTLNSFIDVLIKKGKKKLIRCQKQSDTKLMRVRRQMSQESDLTIMKECLWIMLLIDLNFAVPDTVLPET